VIPVGGPSGPGATAERPALPLGWLLLACQFMDEPGVSRRAGGRVHLLAGLESLSECTFADVDGPTLTLVPATGSSRARACLRL
jgi:hypothetical protein